MGSENDYHGNENLARKTLGVTDLKLGMHIQLHSLSNMGLVPLGHTSSFLCVRQKMPKMVFQHKTLELRELDPRTHIYLESI